MCRLGARMNERHVLGLLHLEGPVTNGKGREKLEGEFAVLATAFCCLALHVRTRRNVVGVGVLRFPSVVGPGSIAIAGLIASDGRADGKGHAVVVDVAILGTGWLMRLDGLDGHITKYTDGHTGCYGGQGKKS